MSRGKKPANELKIESESINSKTSRFPIIAWKTKEGNKKELKLALAKKGESRVSLQA